MSQYSVVASRYIPPVAPETEIPAAAAAPQPTDAAASLTNVIPSTSISNDMSDEPCSSSQIGNEVLKPKTDTEADKFVKIEDIGSEEHIDMVSTTPSSSPKEAPTGTTLVESSEAAELRRRRLQKFSKTSQ